ncbi:MAG TPA: hypothetical protein VGR00_02390 [Thermoanaerobaculia bacterium]|nr:hypothetical protein [Thermoanaerobaculia bacterium]
MRIRTTFGAVLLAPFLVAVVAEAQNYVSDPHFDNGLTSWMTSTQGNGAVTPFAAEGSPTAPSIHLVASRPNGGADGVAQVFQCATTMPATIDGYARIKVNSAAGMGKSWIAYWFYTGSACTGTLFATSNPPPTSNTGGVFVQFAATGVTPPMGALSYAVAVNAVANLADGDAIDVLTDDVRTGPAGSCVLLDESIPGVTAPPGTVVTQTVCQ